MTELLQKYSAGGVVVDGDKVLTIEWRSKDAIEFPKGTVEATESPEQTAIREIFEETGYKVKIIELIDSVHYEFERDMKHYQKTVDFFLMELVDDNEPTPQREDGEDFENLWLSIDDARKLLTHDDSKMILEKVANAIR